MTSIRTSMPAPSKNRWREWRRFLLATLAITLLYLGIQAIWMMGAAELAHHGWTVNDPARTYADEAAALAQSTRPREAALPAGFARQVFRLGFEYGYLSQWLGGYGQQTDDVMRQLSRPVAGHLRHLDELAGQLGVAPVERLPMRTAADFSRLAQRIEEDPDGVAGRIENVGSPRLRHLFLLGAHVGTMNAALESPGDLMPIPATQLIGKHATLAGVPENLWRPLGRLARGAPDAVRREYRDATARLDGALP